MENISIRRLIGKISSGEIRIPSFQRGFVWEPEAVAFLMDSLFKGYPIGAVLLWTQAHCRLHFGGQGGNWLCRRFRYEELRL